MVVFLNVFEFSTFRPGGLSKWSITYSEFFRLFNLGGGSKRVDITDLF